jgi:hypothetical protein
MGETYYVSLDKVRKLLRSLSAGVNSNYYRSPTHRRPTTDRRSAPHRRSTADRRAKPKAKPKPRAKPKQPKPYGFGDWVRTW